MCIRDRASEGRGGDATPQTTTAPAPSGSIELVAGCTALRVAPAASATLGGVLFMPCAPSRAPTPRHCDTLSFGAHGGAARVACAGADPDTGAPLLLLLAGGEMADAAAELCAVIPDAMLLDACVDAASRDDGDGIDGDGGGDGGGGRRRVASNAAESARVERALVASLVAVYTDAIWRAHVRLAAARLLICAAPCLSLIHI